MKQYNYLLITLLIALICAAALGTVKTKDVTGSVGSPIPITFDVADPQSAVVVCEGSPKHLKVFNATDVKVALFVSKQSTSPSNSVANQLYIPMGTGGAWDLLPITEGATVFLRAIGSAAALESRAILTGRFSLLGTAALTKLSWPVPVRSVIS